MIHDSAFFQAVAIQMKPKVSVALSVHCSGVVSAFVLDCLFTEGVSLVGVIMEKSL
jgi:hypothetical protein